MTSPSNPSPSTNKNTPTDRIDSRTAEERSSEAISTLTARLREDDVPIERCIPLVPKTKTPNLNDHTNPEKHGVPDSFTGRDYAVHAGRGLLVIDIDDLSAVPEWIQQLPNTFIVSTPHQGYHLYYIIEAAEGIQTRNLSWGEIKYDGVCVVGPGSIYDHNNCDNPSEKENCPGSGIGEYNISNNSPLARLDEDDVDVIRETCNQESEQPNPKSNERSDCLESVNQSRADRENDWLCSEFLPKNAGEAAGNALMDVLRGGDGGHDWRRNNDPSSIDQSVADFYALEKLYGAFLWRGDDENEALVNSIAVFKHFCLENEFDKTGNRRKWLRKGDAYLSSTAQSVQNQFERGEWFRWMRWRYQDGFDPDEQRPWIDPVRDGKPSEITDDTVLAAVWFLSSPVDIEIEELGQIFCIDLQEGSESNVSKYLPPSATQNRETEGGQYPKRQYPTAREVAGFAHELNPDRSTEYFRDVVRQLSRREVGPRAGQIEKAYCPSRPNGHRHVYYIAQLSHPPDARWVKRDGERKNPDKNQR